MGKYHFFPEETRERLEPSAMGLVYTSLQRLELGGEVEVHSEREETCVVVIEGELRYQYGDERSGVAVTRDMLYLPVGETLTLSGQDAVAIRYGAPCARKTSFAHIRFEEVDADSNRHKTFGSREQGTLREVWNYIDDSFDSSRMLAGICYGSHGGWTAWPPHEHAAKREEVYVYFNMGDGFALQCVYEDLKNPHAVALVQNGHVVSIPSGYHPNVGCPKTGIRYVYFMVSTKAEDRVFMDLNMQKEYGDKL